MKTLVLALGNPIVSDDGVAWAVADRLEPLLPSYAFEIRRENGATLDLINHLDGFGRVLFIDAIQLGTAPPGTLHRFTLDDFRSTIRYSSAHDINFATAFEIGRQFGYHVPDDVRIYGIEVRELRVFCDHLTPEIQAALPAVTDELAREILALPALQKA